MIRNKSSESYRWVVRTRFDISFLDRYSDGCPHPKFDYFETIPKCSDIYVDLDTISIGSPEVIDIESSLGLLYPYVPRYIEHRVCSDNEIIDKYEVYKYSDDSSYIMMNEKNMKFWLYMPEFNLGLFLNSKGLNVISLHSGLHITR